MTRWFLLLAILPVAGAGAQSARFKAACEETISTSVTTRLGKPSAPVIDNSRPYASLGAAKPPHFVLGLTDIPGSHFTFNWGVVELEDTSSPNECIAPRIDLQINYAPITVYIGSEFKPGTCAYDAILEHEMRHVDTYLAYMPDVERRVDAALRKRFDGRSMYAPKGQARARLTEEINRTWIPMARDEMQKIKAMEDAIDTPEEYARISKVCGGEIHLIIGRALAR